MEGLGQRLCWHLLVPAAIGASTGACVAGASAAVEGFALARLATLPGALPAIFAPVALIATLLVSRYVTRAERPATSELYILTYHHPETRLPLEQVPGRPPYRINPIFPDHIRRSCGRRRTSPCGRYS